MNIAHELDQLINREGGFVDDPNDNGGATKYGITQKTLSLWRAREVTVDDVAMLTKREAREIYYAWYYIKPGIDSLPCALQPILFDMSANHGPSRAIKILQDALACHGYPVGKIDGKLGQKTLACCQQGWLDRGTRLVDSLVNRRVIFYENIVKADDTQRKFLHGWVARAESFRVEQSA